MRVSKTVKSIKPPSSYYSGIHLRLYLTLEIESHIMSTHSGCKAHLWPLRAESALDSGT